MQGGKSSCMCEPKTTKGKRDRHLLWMGWVARSLGASPFWLSSNSWVRKNERKFWDTKEEGKGKGKGGRLERG